MAKNSAGRRAVGGKAATRVEEHIFASVYESGVNDLLAAIFRTRPHYLNYGSRYFVPQNTVNETNVPPISFPGLPGGVIEYRIGFDVPVIDFHPDSTGGALPLPLPSGNFSLHSKGEFLVRTTRTTQSAIELWAVGQMVFVTGDAIGVQLTDLRLVGVQPASLQALMESIVQAILQIGLGNIAIPVSAISLGFAELTVVRSPYIANDSVTISANVN